MLSTSFPELSEARILSTDVNLRPASFDNKPFFQIKDNLVHVNGLFRHGWLVAPALLLEVFSNLNIPLSDPLLLPNEKNNIKFGDRQLSIDENTTLEDFLKNQKVDTRNLATSVNADLILKEKRKDKVLKEMDHINIFGPITGG